MGCEIELKLQVHKEQVPIILQCPVLQAFNYQKLRLSNTYYDSIDYQLTEKKMALRVRQQGRRYIQTLKMQGKSEAGLSERQEFEWELPSNQLDISLITEASFKQQINANSFLSLFTTHFIRHEFSNTDLEIAMDIGEVAAGPKKQSICELEIELKGSNVELIFDLAIELSKYAVLLPSNQSKAQTGYQLVLGNRPLTAVRMEMPNLQVDRTVSEHWQQLMPVFSEAWGAFTQQGHQIEFLSVAYQCLILMQQLIDHCSLINKNLLYSELTWLLQQIELLQRYNALQRISLKQALIRGEKSMVQQLANLLHDTRLGYVLLLIAQANYYLINDH